MLNYELRDTGSRNQLPVTSNERDIDVKVEIVRIYLNFYWRRDFHNLSSVVFILSWCQSGSEYGSKEKYIFLLYIQASGIPGILI
jgi:hypothetical protein